ncbi:MAG: MerR family transcriptional regulator [Elusimicrobia bacterium]|nr:MerR family transcriptional regulator [Elusimicrobiota bacterium]
MGAHLTIGKVAKRAGVNIQTVRYYERRGFIKPDARRDSGYRLYGEDTVRRILFIKNAQELGFTLKETDRLLRLSVGKKDRCEDVRKKAEAHFEDVQDKIKRLKSIEKVLGELIRTCLKKGRTDPCPILRSLEVSRR